jgi:hypothetical protein
MSGYTGTIICVVLAFLLLPMAFLFLRLCCRRTPSSNSRSQSSQSRPPTDIETQALASTPATILPLYRIVEAHSVVQSVGGQVVLTMEGGYESDGVRAQQLRALARYEDLSSSSSPRNPRPAAAIAQERRALGRHARNETLSTSSTSHLLAPASSPSLPPGASAFATPLASSGVNRQEQDYDHDRDPDLRAQVRQLQEEVERLRTERAAPPQERPPAYQSDAGFAH